MSKGPVWHQKQKKRGIMPKNLHGVDREATWGVSKAKGWIYGHGTFMLTPYDMPIVGIFQWMPNSGNEAKRMETEIVRYEGLVKKIFMDSKADDKDLYWSLKDNHKIQLVTSPRKGMNKSPERKMMIKDMLTKRNKRDYQKRSTTVEPMQGLIDNIFELEKCWMRGDSNNRWLFAAMGVATQMAQWHAYRDNRSTWNIKSWVLGV
ncbi:MAG: hypothetical protein HY980_00950 [Candidatus Magasanikbacteria bacterium]|nr:hypothetical protein [Candidatus Magasanikbacteria bacterium]